MELMEGWRVYGASLVREAGLLLRCRQSTICSGLVLFHRVLGLEGKPALNVVHVAMASVVLAGKVEEDRKEVRDVINVFHRVLWLKKGETNPEPLGRYAEIYERWKSIIFETEMLVLEELGFRVHCEHPHKFLLNYVKVIDGTKELAQKAWNCLNDSMMTSLCLQARPQDIAAGAIFIAAQMLGFSLPDNPPWYLLFGTSKEKIDLVVRQISTLQMAIDADDFQPDMEELGLEDTVNSPPQSSLDQLAGSSETRQHLNRERDSNRGDDRPLSRFRDRENRSRRRRSRSRSRSRTRSDARSRKRHDGYQRDRDYRRRY